MGKVFNDPIHGNIEIHPLCVKIIDTPQFQRLRYLKQLGACYFVYPGASHNRFEHSIGVSFLAGIFVRSLKEYQTKELDITEEDVLCVELAGLCHDLGHGPFSHMFEQKFIPHVKPDIEWTHEDGSVMMFEHIIEENNLKENFLEHNLKNQDIIFIKELIAGPLKRSTDNTEKWLYKGRGENKSFLYEIVANKRNGIDVDKWDYFARDCHGLGLKNNFDHMRCMKFSRVLEVDGIRQICFRDKEADTLYKMFSIRATLHRRAYQHRVSNIIQAMITDAFIEANQTPLVQGKNGELLKMSNCIEDAVAYTNLNDNIFYVILMSTADELTQSRAILKRVHHRRLYKCVGETYSINKNRMIQNNEKKTEDQIIYEIVKKSRGKLKENDVLVTLVKLDYGTNENNPIDNVRFYNKNDPCKGMKLDEQHTVSLVLPKLFAEIFIRVYCKKEDEETIQTVKQCFLEWCQENGIKHKDDFVCPGDNEKVRHVNL